MDTSQSDDFHIYVYHSIWGFRSFYFTVWILTWCRTRSPTKDSLCTAAVTHDRGGCSAEGTGPESDAQVCVVQDRSWPADPAPRDPQMKPVLHSNCRSRPAGLLSAHFLGKWGFNRKRLAFLEMLLKHVCLLNLCQKCWLPRAYIFISPFRVSSVWCSVKPFSEI